MWVLLKQQFKQRVLKYQSQNMQIDKNNIVQVQCTIVASSSV